MEHELYLLDEVTDSLDHGTERIITQAIERLTRGKTRITIAHRLHTIENADYVLMIDKCGQVADFGKTRDILLDKLTYSNYIADLKLVS